MLNGIAPLLIFNFPIPLEPPSVAGPQLETKGIPLLIQKFQTDIGIPIPLYLDENLTGIYIESESKAIDIETNSQQRFDGKAPSVDQRGLNNLVTINMVASKNSIVLGVLLALNDMIFSRVVSKTYNVSYLNGVTTIFGGLLHGFSTSSGIDNDLIKVVMQISKANLSPPTKGGTQIQNKFITGATPVPVSS
jgi:hypothetical protein